LYIGCLFWCRSFQKQMRGGVLPFQNILSFPLVLVPDPLYLLKPYSHIPYISNKSWNPNPGNVVALLQCSGTESVSFKGGQRKEGHLQNRNKNFVALENPTTRSFPNFFIYLILCFSIVRINSDASALRVLAKVPVRQSFF
jgi:hypothetical protein